MMEHIKNEFQSSGIDSDDDCCDDDGEYQQKIARVMDSPLRRARSVQLVVSTPSSHSTKEGVSLSRKSFATATLSSQSRKGKLTVASRRSPKQRQLSRDRPKEGEEEPGVVTPEKRSSRKETASSSSRKRDSKKKETNPRMTDKCSEGVILYCPNNYDDDISSITDIFFHSASKMREIGHERGQDISFKLPARCHTTGTIGEGSKSSNDDNNDYARPHWLHKNSTRRKLKNKKKRVSDSGVGNTSNHKGNNNDNDMIALLPPWSLKEQDELTSSPMSATSFTTRSTTTTRGQEESTLLPPPFHHSPHKRGGEKQLLPTHSSHSSASGITNTSISTRGQDDILCDIPTSRYSFTNRRNKH